MSFGLATWGEDWGDRSQVLTRNSHQSTAVGAHLPHFAKALWGWPESMALGSDKGLDVLYSTPAHFVSLAPSISGHLRSLASCPGEKCELIVFRVCCS